jgi:predicted nucleotidyltransferase
VARLETLRRVLEPLENDVLGAYLFGSHATGHATSRSDVDVCLVAGPKREPVEVLRAAWRKTRLREDGYDVQVFEQMPLYLKAQVLEQGDLILSRDEPTLSEHLRRWRKIWNDQAHRNRTTEEDVERILQARGNDPEDRDSPRSPP